MEYITAILLGILGCALSFAAGAVIDSAVNKLCTRMDKQRIITLERTIEIQKGTIDSMKRTNDLLKR